MGKRENKDTTPMNIKHQNTIPGRLHYENEIIIGQRSCELILDGVVRERIPESFNKNYVLT